MRTDIWTHKELKQLAKWYPAKHNDWISDKLGRSACSIRTKAVKMGLKKEVPAHIVFTPEKKKILFDLYPTTRNRDIAKRLKMTEAAIIAAGFRYKLRKDPAKLLEWSSKGFYQKGQEPFNKGKKWKEFMTRQGMRNSRKTQIKKGAVPPNHKPVGYERVSKDGYIEVKVGEGLRQFRLKHRVVWEQHYGPIPKGYNVEFKNRDKKDLRPENLVLRTRKENMKQNTYHNYGPEIARTIQLRGALNRQINKHVKRLSNEK